MLEVHAANTGTQSVMSVNGNQSPSFEASAEANDAIDPVPSTSNDNSALTSAASPTVEPLHAGRDGDPMSLAKYRHDNITRRHMKTQHPEAAPKLMKKYYAQQNDMIDQFLNSNDEERLKALDTEKYGPKVKFAVNASSTVNVILFIIQLYAAISTGSLSLFATAADAFVR